MENTELQWENHPGAPAIWQQLFRQNPGISSAGVCIDAALRSECVLFPIWKYKAINENMRKKSFSGLFHNTMPVKVDKAAFRL
ncbi:hypothetical protein DMI72_11065 [Akkermansia muciniphila]|nr:hypothetical protein DMI71_10905 [Akkermansia muciniphila]QHV56673.1 hypothetical protein DMI72_11065 [Akkermansia muciniphila]QHV59035.1 hypothetical protein DMI73_10930 [Akkermansia muciniphila]QHV60227.1 hypothetical protein DMI74_04320 [Akkermansia muciniphila]